MGSISRGELPAKTLTASAPIIWSSSTAPWPVKSRRPRKALQTLKRFEPDLSLETLDMAVYARDEDRRRYFEAFRLSGLE